MGMGGGGGGSVLRDVEGLGGEDEKLGSDGVRSTFRLGLLSIEESVFERDSILLASFVGDDNGEDVGVAAWNIADRSLAIPSPLDAIGLGSCRFGEPYVRRTRGGDGKGSWLSSPISVDGDGSLSTETFLRFTAGAASIDCFRFANDFLPYVRAL